MVYAMSNERFDLIQRAEALCPKAIPFITLLDLESTSSNLICSCSRPTTLLVPKSQTSNVQKRGFGFPGPNGAKRFKSVCSFFVISLKSITASISISRAKVSSLEQSRSFLQILDALLQLSNLFFVAVFAFDLPYLLLMLVLSTKIPFLG